MRDTIVDGGRDVEVEASSEEPAWACLNDEVKQIPAEMPLHVFARYQTLDGAPITGLSVSACTGFVTCSPYAGTPKLTDANGLFALETTQPVPGGFRGTLETQASDGGGAPLPSILVIQPGETNTHSLQPPGDGRPRYPTPMLTSADLASYAAAAGTTPALSINPSAGHAILMGLDCLRDVVVDATITTDFRTAETVTLYLDDGGKPNKDLTKTSKSGRVVILNVPAGSTTFNFTRSDGLKVVSQSVLMRAGSVSYAYLAPPISPPGL